MAPRHAWFTLTARTVFIVFNAFYSVIALGLLALGLALVVTQVNVTLIAGSDLYTGGTIVTIAGVLSFVLSMLGIVAASGKMRILLGAYIFMLVVTLILSEAGGLIGLLYKPYISEFPTYFMDSMEKYYISDSPDFDSSTNKVVDYYQNTYHCCGSEWAHDWENYSTYLSGSGGILPRSCSCDPSPREPGSCATWQIAHDGGLVNQTAWSMGCSEVVQSELTTLTYSLSILGVMGGILQIPGLLLAIALIVFISRIRYEGYIQL